MHRVHILKVGLATLLQQCLASYICYHKNTCLGSTCLADAITNGIVDKCYATEAYGCFFDITQPRQESAALSSKVKVVARCAFEPCKSVGEVTSSTVHIRQCCFSEYCNSNRTVASVGANQCNVVNCNGSRSSNSTCFDDVIRAGHAATCTMDNAKGCFFSALSHGNMTAILAGCASDTCTSKQDSMTRNLCCNFHKCNNGTEYPVTSAASLDNRAVAALMIIFTISDRLHRLCRR